MVLVFFDLETTGLSTQHDRILSIAALVPAAPGEQAPRFEALVRPHPYRPIPPRASAVHGIRWADVAHAPDWAVTGPRFWAWLAAQKERAADDELVLAGYNSRRFDTQMLLREFERIGPMEGWPAGTGIPLGGVRSVDLLEVARALFPNRKLVRSLRQAAVYELLFGEQPADQHDAMGDVLALARIGSCARFARLLERHTYELTGLPTPAPPPTPALSPLPGAAATRRRRTWRSLAWLVKEARRPCTARKWPSTTVCGKCGRRWSLYFADHTCAADAKKGPTGAHTIAT